MSLYCVLRYKEDSLWHIYGPFRTTDEAINWAEKEYGPYHQDRKDGDYWEIHSLLFPNKYI